MPTDNKPERGVVADAAHQAGVALLGCVGIIAIVAFFIWLWTR